MLPLPWPDAAFTHRHLALRVPSFPRSAAPCCARWRGCARRAAPCWWWTARPRPTRPTPSTGWRSLRDPSHARALPLAEHLELFRGAGLPGAARDALPPRGRAGGAASRARSPSPATTRRIRAIFADSLADDALGMQVRRDGDTHPLRLSGGRAGRPAELRTPCASSICQFPIKPHFRWKVEPTLRSSHARGDDFQSTILTIACHAYTHVDAPVHFLPGDRDIASMPVDQWIGPAAVVDLTHLGDNGEVSAAELDRHAGHVAGRRHRAAPHRLAEEGRRGRPRSSGRTRRTRRRAPATGWWPAG